MEYLAAELISILSHGHTYDCQRIWTCLPLDPKNGAKIKAFRAMPVAPDKGVTGMV